MSVVVIATFPGAHRDTFLKVAGANEEALRAIAEESRAAGALHHMFVDDGTGNVLVVDEWNSRADFDSFFEGHEGIERLVAELGITGAPSVIDYPVIDTVDRF